MGYVTHPSIIVLTKDNCESWKKGIITHCRWLNIFPHPYGLILELEKTYKKC